MALSEELERLGALHQRGVLSEDEFARAKDRVLAASRPAGSAPAVVALNALRRSRSDRWLGGVCGGLARVSGLAAWMWRLLFALLLLCAGSGLFVYAVMWVLLPLDEEPLGGSDGQLYPR